MRTATVYGLRNVWPRLGTGVYIAPTAAVIGDVRLGDHVSVWFGAVVRGDEAAINIGARSNIQDGCVIHTNRGGPGVEIGESVTVGHGARLHGCHIESGALIGIGAIVLDGAIVESGALVAAGALVTPGKRVSSGELWAGSPAACRRPLNGEERAMLQLAAAIYIEDAARYLDDCIPRPA